MLVKLRFWIEQVPWYLYALFILYFVYQIYTNPENITLVLINVIGAACFAYVTNHNLNLQQLSGRDK